MRVPRFRIRVFTALGAVFVTTIAAITVPAAFTTSAAAGSTVATGTTASNDVVVAAAGASGQGWTFRDQQGREVTLRGFNVSGSAKLRETGMLPFKTTAEAAASAQAMRDLTGANVIRFLILWEGVQPAADQIDQTYLDRAAAQIQQFTSRGIRVLLDWHQDLYSAALFNSGSWYTGDGAPAWVIQAGGYPQESCGICLMWGQNMLSNTAVRAAAYDFWHNRTVTTTSSTSTSTSTSTSITVALQDAYLQQAGAALAGLSQRMPADALRMVIGVDPFNEPFDGGLDSATGVTWEKNYLWPFYQRFRTVMDNAGWADKPEFVEPLVFWNNGVSEEGGLSSLPVLGGDYVFNAHYYDGVRMTINPGSASDGSYSTAMNEIRDRATTLGTSAVVSEFGNAMSGTSSSSRTPWMIRAMYQGLDSRLSGASFFNQAAGAGTVISAMQWHWDPASGQHSEAMNGNQSKIQTSGDAWNGEDFSVVNTSTTGTSTTGTSTGGPVVPRLDIRVLDRMYPSAVAGQRLAFAYEDLARSGFAGAGTEQAWLTVPSSLPATASLVSGRQFGILVWRDSGIGSAGTELHLPAAFSPAGTVVVSDLASATVTNELGSSTAHRLVIDGSGGSSGAVHFALVVNAAAGTAPSQAQLTTVRAELGAWVAGTSWK